MEKKRAAWTRDEYDRIWRKAKLPLRNVLTLGCNAGLRINALFNLEGRDLQFAKPSEPGFGFFVVRPELDKTHVGYSVPISAECHNLLVELLAERAKGHDFVLQNSKGLPHKNPSVIAVGIRRSSIKAGFERPNSPCHAMRRTFGRWAVLGTLTGRPVPLYVVSKWMGHASVSMTEHYLGLVNTASQDWMAQVPPTSP